jgi:hypothetical protein
MVNAGMTDPAWDQPLIWCLGPQSLDLEAAEAEDLAVEQVDSSGLDGGTSHGLRLSRPSHDLLNTIRMAGYVPSRSRRAGCLRWFTSVSIPGSCDRRQRPGL